ncbi:GTPase HflX [Lysobacteraceae bacterium NML120232]|nr:GTPase HflX [Xanthomonadaceae bacterium NML08-0793]PJK12599.1 GTPase HflX [Xanthomonadaceae bacterium NML120232]
MFDRSRKGENALLIQPHTGSSADEEVIEEFAELARSAGAKVLQVATARIDRPNPATLIGSGKLEEIRAVAEALAADLILVNHALTPVQERNLEKALERRVVDRTGLILDIFAQRAQSHEGKLQVELAQLKHLATRLVRGWTHLERQRGGAIGLRGPGETQLETDRRLLQKRVDQLQKKLEKVEVQRSQMRRARVRSALPRIALVGYTNAGKSTLFNALTGAAAYAADQLFATLDPTVRRIDLPGGHALLADTVGFVRDLPHELVAAFRSTLSEAREADLLLHVIDIADPLREERIRQVDAVLEEIGAGGLPQMLVYNKIDRQEAIQPRFERGEDTRPRAYVSARDHLGLDALREGIAAHFGLQRLVARLRLPSHAARLRSRLHDLGAVRAESHDEHGWQLDIDLPRSDAERLLSEPGADVIRALLPAPDDDPMY